MITMPKMLLQIMSKKKKNQSFTSQSWWTVVVPVDRDGGS